MQQVTANHNLACNLWLSALVSFFEMQVFCHRSSPPTAIHSKYGCSVALLKHHVCVQKQENLLDKAGFSKLLRSDSVPMGLLPTQLLPQACADIQQQDQNAALACAHRSVWQWSPSLDGYSTRRYNDLLSAIGRELFT